MLEHFVSRAATEMSYNIRSCCLKDIIAENNWTYELGVGDRIDIPINLIETFMQKDQFNQQHQNNDTF